MHNTISNIIITDIEYSLFDIEAYTISEPDIEDLVFDIVVSTISYVFSTRDIEALNLDIEYSVFNIVGLYYIVLFVIVQNYDIEYTVFNIEI